jgi:hypothetical protein
MGFCFLWFYLKRSTPQNNLYAMRYALCALRYFEVTMPAIASLEDLKAAQKEGLSIYAMLSALCALLYGNGGTLVGKIFLNFGWRSGPRRS